MIGVVKAGIVVRDVQDAEAAAREQRAGDDAAKLRADDADVVDALGCWGAEGLRHGRRSLLGFGRAPNPL